MHELLEAVKPRGKALVYDILEGLEFCVADWGGKKANPSLCYEWAFQNEKKLLVSLWFSKMEIDERGIFQKHNFQREIRAHNERIYEIDDKKLKDERTKKEKQQKKIWIRRLNNINSCVQKNRDNKIPLRVMVCEGDGTEFAGIKSASAKMRMLDNVEWHIESYDLTTSDCILRRGPPPKHVSYVDQFSAPSDEACDEVNKKAVSGTVFERSAKVREDVLQRAKGLCEYCGTQGFTRADGAIYLESHHIIPLSEDGPDKIFNVAALCPNHHREAHYGQLRDQIRQRLSAKFSAP